MPEENPNPVVLITGAARRVGAALARHLHHHQFDVILHCFHSTEEANALAQDFNQQRAASAQVLTADLNSMEDLNQLADSALQFKQKLNVLINNASSFFPTPLGNAQEHHWDNLMNSNLKAPFFLSQRLAPQLAQQKGCIVNISDIFAERPMPNHTIYSIAKAGNNMLTQSLALELAPKVRVNGIAPGAILWPENSKGEEVVNLSKLSQIPMARLGGTEAIISAAWYLIHHAPYVTGQIMGVDGGRSLLQ